MLAALWSKIRWYVIGAGAGLALLAGAFFAGRASAPEKVKTDVVHVGASMEATEWGGAVREKVTEGPVRIETHIREVLAPDPPRPEFWPEGCPTCPACPVRETTIVEERGGVVTERGAEAHGYSATVATQADRTTTERQVGDLARWSAAVGGELPGLKLKDARLDAAVGGRIGNAPIWFELTDSAPKDKLGDWKEHAPGLRLRAEF